MLKKDQIDQVFEIFSADNPSPKTELSFTNNYTLLVAVVLSAQATDIGVNKATKSLFEKLDTPEQMVELGEESLKQYIKTIGLFNSKAKNVIALSKDLIEKHNSVVPDNLEDLVALAGVGVKTANVILNCAFGQPTIAVDTHVYRVSNRLGIVKTKTPDQTGDKLVKKIPLKWRMHAHHWLILQGRYICKARKPICNDCKVNHICEFKDKNLTT
jgi:endonuclease-3